MNSGPSKENPRDLLSLRGRNGQAEGRQVGVCLGRCVLSSR